MSAKPNFNPDSVDSLFDAKKIAFGLFAPVIVFVGLNLFLGFLLFSGADDTVGMAGFLRFFDLNAEQTVPAWYSTVLLALSATISWIIARYQHASECRFTLHWYLLCAIFLFLSMDENLAIHERCIKPVREYLGVGGLLHWAWVVPGWIFVILVGLFFLKFVWDLSPRIRFHVIGSGIVYVTGALVFEMLGGYLIQRFGTGVATDLSTMIEEVLEFVGITWFIYAQLECLWIIPGIEKK